MVASFVPQLRAPASLLLRVFVEQTQSQRWAVRSGVRPVWHRLRGRYDRPLAVGLQRQLSLWSLL